MVDKTVTAPEAPANEPPLPDDSKQWADLAKELEGEGEGEEGEQPKPEGEATPEPEGDKPAAEEKPKLSYEQLESNYRNAQGAFTEARERARRAEESLTNVNKLIDDLRSSRRQPTPQPAQDEIKIPDVNEDPIGHFQARTAILEQALQHTYQGTQATQQHLQAQHQEQVFWDHVRAAENEYRKTAPVVEVNGQQVSDYDAACEHLKQHRMTELMHLYPDNSQLAQQEAHAHGLPSVGHLRAVILQSDAAGIAQRAFQLGVSPAQLYYEAAKTRGYKATQQARGSNGQYTKANGQIEAAKRGQKAALSISGGEGRRNANDMTISDLSELWAEDPEAFDREWERMKRAGKL
jgi:hypothetical protein